MSDGKSENSEVIEIPVGKFFGKVKKNPWMSVSVVLIVLLIVTLIYIVKAGGVGSVSANTAGANLINFINAQGQGVATLKSTEKEGSLYKVTVNYNGQDIPVYVTLDGKYLVSPTALDSTGTDTNTNTGERVEIEIGNSPSLGSVDAPVTVVEFSDFSCPFCAAASGDNAELTAYMKQRSPSWEPIVTNMIKDYVDTGKVRFVVKYAYGHSGGHPAQLVAWCLNEQNLYWKFYPKAYAAQDDVEDLAKMKALAKTVGADMTKLQTCLDSGKYDSQFDKELQQGQAAGVQGTPAFFVNGQLVSGAVPYSQIKQLIDQELAA